MPTQLPDRLAAIVRRLVLEEMRGKLPGVPLGDGAKPLEESELARAMCAASLLALSSEFEDKALAYEIVTRGVMLHTPPLPSVVKAAELVLARLGNFPGRDLLNARFAEHTREVKGGNLLRFEANMRRVENTIEDAAGAPKTVTDFQYDALSIFGESKSVSLSAPTSAGKSFVLSLHVIHKLKEIPQASVIYLVPTRALIRQVIVGLRAELTKAGLSDLPIRCIPAPIQRGAAPLGVVYVITQERLMSLLHGENSLDDLWVTNLIVDEAQGIGDEGRGVILHSAIDAVVHRFPKTEVIFASPLASNPQYLLGLFGRASGTPFLERLSPVAQNLIMVRPAAGCIAAFDLLRRDEVITLGSRRLDKDMRSKGALQRRAYFAAKIAAKEGCCLVYANGARDAEKVAEYLVKETQATNTEDSEILEFIAYLSEHVHKDYGLIPVLRKRIAFHYSTMPGNVRAGVEELCRKGKFRFICCTSTLLQGINLPARDVVIENPMKGSTKPMRRADFLNLSGRAGRLTKEFHGNVWCLCPESWEVASFTGEPLQTIESALEVTVRDGGESIIELLDGSVSAGSRKSAVATINRIYTDHLGGNHPIDYAAICAPDKLEKWNSTVTRVQAMKTHLPAHVYARNYSILPSRLEELYHFMINSKDMLALMPIQPGRAGTNIRLWAAMEIQERILEKNQDNSFRHLYHLAKSWLHGAPLGRIITDSLDHGRKTDPKFNERNAIYKTIEDIEKQIRYRVAKNFRAYNDVLAIALRDGGYAEESTRLVPFHLFLESGGYDPIFLALTSLGLSRTSALLLRRKIAFSKDVTPEQCLRALKRISPEFLKLPAFCLRELSDITGRHYGAK
jgi:hypothetical protein